MEQNNIVNSREGDDSILVNDDEPTAELGVDHNDDNNSHRLSPRLATLPETRPRSYSTSPNSSIGSHLNDTGTTTRQRYSAKLRTASRAIGLFRRAAGTLSRSLTLGQMNKSASTSNGLDSGDHSGGGGSDSNRTATNKRRRSSTFRKFMMRHQSTGNSSQNSQNSSQNQSTSGQSSQAHLVSFCDSQQPFIVPRMNALKLPLKCLIKSLDGELMREVFVHRYELGQYLVENLKVSLGMNDCKYFGLRLARSCEDQEDVKNIWLDLNESVCKQIKNKSCSALLASADTMPANGTDTASTRINSGPASRTIEFYLRIKFYPPNLTRIQDAFLRNYLWLQLRRDLRLGKLTSSMNNLAQLMACILQYEFGDFKQEHLERLPEMNIMPNQDLVEDAAIDLWRTRLNNFKRHQAQMQFLRAAIILETYGFDYYPVRDHQRQRAYLLGFNYAGIKTIRNGRIVHHFRWHSISKISYERRMIIFHIYPTENSKRKQILGFKCMSNEYCQCLYMRLLEQKYFFTVDLAFFDKSIRRPSCLFSSPDGSSPRTNDWTNNSIDDSQQYQQQQQHEHQQQLQRQQTQFGNRPNIVRASGSLEDPPSMSSTPECNAYGCNDCCISSSTSTVYQLPPSNLVRSTTMPHEESFDNETMISSDGDSEQISLASGGAVTTQTSTRQRRAALARLHHQQSTTVSFGDGNIGTQPSDEDNHPRVTIRWQQTLPDWSEQSEPSSQERTSDQEIRSGGPESSATEYLPFRIVQKTFRCMLLTTGSIGDQNHLMPIFKLLLLILATNLVLKLANGLSSVLITLLTFLSSGPALSEPQSAANSMAISGEG